MNLKRTAVLTSHHGTARLLEGFDGITVVPVRQGAGFVITFADEALALAAVEKAKTVRVREYLARGGNPRNKRSFGAQFAAVKRAILTAS